MGTNPMWWVVVPLKDTHRAKSRLGGDPGERRRLAIAMARDTLDAVRQASLVAGVVVVCDTDADVEVFTMSGTSVVVSDRSGLNGSIGFGADVVRSRSASRHLAVLPGDLPYLRASELDMALGRAAGVESGCVADRPGTGTTLLTSRAGVPLRPAYGGGSLQAHRAGGAVELGVPAWSGLRRDVDFRDDVTNDAAMNAHTRAMVQGSPWEWWGSRSNGGAA
ncbi:MAG: 2-phospho-L-lactate guanylyltransferase [Nocardioides sp.]|nr:2-phospho-L-lactate guanylyltransferase [Nocardioides sp.]